jgi:polysaccharide biosynthesis transport protein
MNFSQLLLAIKARYKLILLATILTFVAALGVSLLLPKTYIASASMVVNYKGVDPVTGMTLPAQLMPGYIATQVDIIKSKSVALKVVEALKLADNPRLIDKFKSVNDGEGSIQDWIAEMLLGSVNVTPSRDSSVLTINVKANDPQYAAKVANAFSDAYLSFVVQLKTEPAQLASGNINTQIKVLRERYEQAQKRLSQYQQQNDIYSADNRVDVETARLNELSSQLVQIQAQAIDANSRERQAQGNANASPDVFNNPMIQSLKGNLAAAEAKFADTSKRYAANHPQYIAAKSEVDTMRANLNEQIKATSGSVVSNARISQQREAELRSALTAQKSKVMALNSARNEFNVLSNEADNAKRAYELASQRLNQTNFEGQSKQADIAVLSPASAPIKAAGPKLLINSVLALIVGALLGLGIALVMELADQRVRSSVHLGDLIGVPVLGVIGQARMGTRVALPAVPPNVPPKDLLLGA